jgi:hypothetical protein
MHNPRALAQNNGRFRPSGYCLVPHGHGQYVILDAGEMLLDFPGGVQHVDAVGEMRPRFHLQCGGLPKATRGARERFQTRPRPSFRVAQGRGREPSVECSGFFNVRAPPSAPPAAGVGAVEQVPFAEIP